MFRNSTKGLKIIIFLILILSAFTVWGYLGNKNGINKTTNVENINKEFKFNNKLYFYDSENLLGTYSCKTSECDYAKSIIDDDNYSLKYYKKDNDTTIKLISKKYAFISDDNNIILFDVINNKVLNTFKAVKNYGININNNYYILKDLNDKWGVMKIDENTEIIIDFKYDFIGIHNELIENNTLLKSNLFAVKNVNGWKLIDDKGLDKSSYITNQIYDYNDKYIITKAGNYYYINKLTGNLLMSNVFLYTKFVGDYIAVVDKDNDLYVFNPDTMEAKSQKYKVSIIDEMAVEKTNDGIVISIGGILKETIR